MSRTARYLSGVACLLLLAWPMALMRFTGEDSSADVLRTENRQPGKFPEFSARALLDAGFYRGVSDYLRDHLPYRDQATRLRNMLEVRGFGAERSGSVELGQDGWLYYRESLAGDFRTMEYTERAVQLLRERIALHEQQGPPLLFLAAPDKHTVHPEHLRADGRRQVEPSLPLRALLREAVGGSDSALDVWQLLADERQRTGQDMYSPLDSHWNQFAQIAVARAIVTHFAPEVWTEEPIRVVRTGERSGDLARMLNAGIAPVPFVKHVFRGALEEMTSTPLDYNERAKHFTTRSDRPLVPGHTLFLHDSFGNELRWLLPAYFEEMSCVWVDTVNRDSFAELVESHDRVIMEVVERYSARELQRLLGRKGERLVLDADRLPVSAEDESGI